MLDSIQDKSVFAVVLFLGLVLGLWVFCLPNSVSATSHSLSVTYSGAQSITVKPSGGDTGIAISEDSITVATTCRNGYNFTISTSVNDNNLYLNGDSSNNSAGTYFTPSDGSTALNNAPNTWGYYFNANSATAPTSSSTFSPVPVIGSPNIIKSELVAPSSTDIADSFSIYYGVAVSNGMPTGTYKMIPDSASQPPVNGTIVYNVTMANACTQYTVHFNPTSTAGGTTLSGTGTMNDQGIYEGIATALNTNNFTAPSGYSFKEWNTAQDGTGTSYADGASVTDLAVVGSSITLYAQWDIGPLDDTDCPANNICYAPNTSDIDGSMDSISSTKITKSPDAGVQVYTDGTEGTQISSNSTPTLIAPNYSRDGYGFAGWSTDFNATNSSTIYGPNQTITTATDGTGDADVSTNGLILYPVWVKSAGSMQNASSVCSSLTAADWDSTNSKMVATLSSVSALTDQRDGNTYAIAKLKDGNCWMIENLRLDAENSSNASLAQGFGTSTTYGNFTGLADSENSYFKNYTTANSLYYSGNGNQGSLGATIDIGTTNYPGYRMPRYNNNNTNRSLGASYNGTGSSTYYQWYGYGNYYTWAAAMANTGYFTSYSTSDVANTSICPNGWRLPYGNSSNNGATSKGFSYLDTQMGGSGVYASSSTTPTGAERSKVWRSFPNNFVSSGLFYTASAYTRGTTGVYWSSTADINSTSYYLYLTSTGLYPGTGVYDKGAGQSIRCVSNS